MKAMAVRLKMSRETSAGTAPRAVARALSTAFLGGGASAGDR